VSAYVWPDPQALLDDLEELFQEHGQTLVVRAPDDLIAGFARARTFAADEPDAGAAKIAAIFFDGVATRHALLDGNKRLAWQSLTVFLALNDLYLDAPEQAAFGIGTAVITKDRTVDDLAAFVERYVVPLRLLDEAVRPADEARTSTLDRR
jgi:death-on-curing protein